MRILALDDDNHGIYYYSEIQQVNNPYEMVKELAKPHTGKYEVRCISLVDHIHENDENAQNMFDIVQSYRVEYERYINAFNYLWEKISQNDWWEGIIDD